MTLVHNITDVNDKIYEAAPGASAARAEEATAGIPRTRALRPRRGRPLAEGDRNDDPIIRFIEELVGRGFAYEVEGDVYFRVSHWQEYGRLSGQKPIRWRSRSRTRARRIRATSRSGRRTSRTRTPGGTRPGAAAGRAGTSSARRWLPSCSGRSSRSTAAGSTSSSRIMRTSSPSRGRSATSSRSSGCTTDAPLHGEKMSKSLGNIETIQEVLDEWGRETVLLFFLTAHWRKPIDFSEETMAPPRRSGAASSKRSMRIGIQRRRSDGRRSRRRSTTTSTRTGSCRAPRVARSSQLELLQRGLEVFGLGCRRDRGPGGRAGSLQHARPRAPRRTSRRRTTCAIGSPARLGRPGHGRRLRPRPRA